MLTKYERLVRALRSGIEVRMGAYHEGDDERPYRVLLAHDEHGAEVPACVATRERIGEQPEEILLAVDDRVFKIWAEQLTDEELIGYGAASVLRQMADERARGRGVQS